METRAIGCPAYVSFFFFEHHDNSFCMIRKRMKHENHDPQDLDQNMVCPIDNELKAFIREKLREVSLWSFPLYFRIKLMRLIAVCACDICGLQFMNVPVCLEVNMLL